MDRLGLQQPITHVPAPFRHQFGRSEHRFFADRSRPRGPFAVLVEEEFPEPLLHPPLLAIGTGERLRPAFQVEIMRCVPFLQKEIRRQRFFFGAFGVLPEMRAEPHLGGGVEIHGGNDFLWATGVKRYALFPAERSAKCKAVAEHGQRAA